MPIARRGAEFRVELRSHEERMIGQLDQLHQAVAREAGKTQARVHEFLQVAVVEFEAMPMTFHDRVGAEDLMRLRAVGNAAFLRAQAHRAAEIRTLGALLDGAFLILPFADQGDDRMRRRGVEFRRVRAFELGNVARIFDDRQLHAQANAQVGNRMLARIANRLHLAFHAAFAKAAWNQYRIDAIEAAGAMLFHVGGLDELNVDASPGTHAGMRQRFDQGHVCIAQVDVLADHRHVDGGFRIGFGVHDPTPLAKIGGRHV